VKELLLLRGVTNLIPGPNSTELVLHLGYLRRGRWELIAAGVAFILPAVVITTLLARGFQRYGQFPALAAGLPRGSDGVVAVAPLTFFPGAGSVAGPTPLSLGGFLLKIGATLYGSGCVLISFLR